VAPTRLPDARERRRSQAGFIAAFSRDVRERVRMEPNDNKSARTVGDVSANIIRTVTSRVYDALVRREQDFRWLPRSTGRAISARCRTGDLPAGDAVHESRLTTDREVALDDHRHGHVDFQANMTTRTRADGTAANSRTSWSTAPAVLRVGMATNIRRHNLGEVIDAVSRWIEPYGLSIDELITSFPSGFQTAASHRTAKAYD